jgi:formylglycine-generating enzyme required for sulfatase activity
MDNPVTLLTLVAGAVLEAAPEELIAGTVLHRLPKLATRILEQWQADCPPDQQRAEIQTLARTASFQAYEQARDLARKLVQGGSEELRTALANYLTHIPAAVRRALRSPADSLGETVPGDLTLSQSEDLLLLLPVRRPALELGMRPLPGSPWELDDLLGVGILDEVWRARDPRLQHSDPVVLKFCLDMASAKVLRHEARQLERVKLRARHPGIVTLRQAHLASDPPCLEYEFRPAGSLASALQDWRRQPQGPSVNQIARIILRLSSIMAFAHRLEPPIVHRDLKPANVLVQRLSDGKVSIRIADLGYGAVAISDALRQELRGERQPFQVIAELRGAHTPLYASPQQRRGAEPDPRDDVYALGVIWFQLLNGSLISSPPQDGRWPQQLAERGMSTGQLDLLIACVQENADDRPRHAGELADRLTRILHAAKTASPEVVASVAPQIEMAPRRVTNCLHMTLLMIGPGSFRMGSPPTEVERGTDEGPQREVTISQPFYMSINPVTQRQFEQVMGRNPSYFTEGKGGGTDHPVERISWDDAQEFCRRLSELPAEQAAGRVYRLPTEAEWEFACRAGQTSAFAFGPALSSRDANFNGNYPYGGAERGPYLERTSRVASYLPNAFGLFDMHGNVWEWCGDFYDHGYLRTGPGMDPPGPLAGSKRVVRGGSCYNIGRFCRSAYRFGVAPSNRALDIGLRVVMTVH